MSDFGLCATDAREPRQVRKEATVACLSVCRRSTRSLAQMILDLGFWIDHPSAHASQAGLVSRPLANGAKTPQRLVQSKTWSKRR